MKRILFFFLVIVLLPKILVLTTGCAQIVAPTGGPRDTIPPKLISANPKQGATNFKGNRITLDFNEYIQIDELQQNLLVAPAPKHNPLVDWKLRTVTIKLKDTLEPNTTYSINLGNAIKDLNENNPVKNFVYVFSTGSYLDSLEFSGKVQVAETGKIDSTILVFLYKNLNDTAVQKEKPKYIARLNGEGNFTFSNLAPGLYKVYALLDGNGSRTYDSKSEMFAFADSAINVTSNTRQVTLYAYVEEKEKEKIAVTRSTDKKLKYTTKIPVETQDLLSGVTIEFNKPLKTFDKQKIILTDTLNNILKDAVVSIDSTNKKITVENKWLENLDYKLIVSKDMGADSTGLTLLKSDTIHFKTKKETDYGSLELHFINLNKIKNPVLQFVQGNDVVKSYALTSGEWSDKLFTPGEYELRILSDENKNGKWNAGNYLLKKQPEKVISVSQKINVKANWDNDIKDITL